jgi:hypothetical protein
MHKVFINYRTGDGDEAAAMIENDLSKRFGSNLIFRAAKSIRPGTAYAEELLNAVRQSAVLLAVMGPEWPHDPRLRDENDWVRREILEAYEYAVRVIPVLKGRKTDRLNIQSLPPELQRLAEVQSLRLDTRDNGADLARIGDELADLIPELKELDRSPSTTPVRNSVKGVLGTSVQSGTIAGDVGTVVKQNQGPVHTGKGDINQHSPRITGDGAAYIAGNNQGRISHTFGSSRRDEDDR